MSKMVERKIESHIFVIMGATGNLARKKLFPALYKLSSLKPSNSKLLILGVARKKLSDHNFRVYVRQTLIDSGIQLKGKAYSNWCDSRLFYHSLGNRNIPNYENLSSKLAFLEQKYSLLGNRIFDMALPPDIFSQALKGLGEAGLNKSSGWTRLVIEKPFGTDLASAKKLNRLTHKYFMESQIYRIDHFLGKETVQNLMVFRFANTIFNHLWHRDHIKKVEILVAETAGIEGRSDYYDKIGALRDMIQNHLTQLLTLIAMEPSVKFGAKFIRNEKVKVLEQISPIQQENVVLGQYDSGKIDHEKVISYRTEPNIPSDSKTATFVALNLEINTPRWKGVPFSLITGKRLPERLTKITIIFHDSLVSMFPAPSSQFPLNPNALTVTIQPDEGFDLRFQVKSIGQPISLSSQKLHFNYSEAFGSLPDAYETLLLDVINGDQTLFVRYDEVENAWRIYDSILPESIPVYEYTAGTWGPQRALNFFSESIKNI